MQDSSSREATEHIRTICAALAEGELSTAAELARQYFPFREGDRSRFSWSSPIETRACALHLPAEPTAEAFAERKYSDFEIIELLFRDGFLDRYTGDRLIYQGVLRLLSLQPPAEVPFHPNWAYAKSNRMYWDFWPTVDHVVPVSHGVSTSSNDKANWVSCSMLTNLKKGNRTFEERGWVLKPPGDWRNWDGLLSWFLKHVAEHTELLKDRAINRWYKAGRTAIKSFDPAKQNIEMVSACNTSTAKAPVAANEELQAASSPGASFIDEGERVESHIEPARKGSELGRPSLGKRFYIVTERETQDYPVLVEGADWREAQENARRQSRVLNALGSQLSAWPISAQKAARFRAGEKIKLKQ